MESKQGMNTLSQYYKRLRSFIRKRVMSVDEAEDILQTVFYQFTKANSLISPIEHVTAWLYQAARNQIVDHHRKKKETLFSDYYIDDDDDEEYSFSDAFAFLFVETETPESEYIKDMFWNEIELALASLPPEQRDVFEMTEFDGISFKALAEQTGVNINTLLARKRYAVKALQVHLSEIYGQMITA